MSDTFDKILAEARADLGTREVKTVDWSAVDAALFARIEKARHADRARFAPDLARSRTFVAVSLAIAAVVVAVLVGTREGREGRDAEWPVADRAGAVVSIEGDSPGDEGSLLVDGKSGVRGMNLRLGDVLETRGARATIERPGKLTATLESGSRAVVAHTQGALVLALELGAVEAQVVPVTAGEAFAIDVDGSRVAVHGTHLRVARAGDHVTIDLNEGVVAIGEAPRVGSVIGTLVNAPAHIEFMASDVLRTLKETHDPYAVRRPAGPAPAATVDRPLGLPRPESSAGRSPVPGLSGETRPEGRVAQGVAVAKPVAPVPVSGPKPEEASPEAAIMSAVQECMAERPHLDNVTLVVSTTLHLDLTDDGTVRAARFDPPVAPEVNECAAEAIYRQRFVHGGAADIAVDFRN